MANALFNHKGGVGNSGIGKAEAVGQRANTGPIRPKVSPEWGKYHKFCTTAWKPMAPSGSCAPPKLNDRGCDDQENFKQ